MSHTYNNNTINKAATGWSVFASGVDLGRSQVLSGPPYCR